MSLIQHANDELRRVGYPLGSTDRTNPNVNMHAALIELLLVFAKNTPNAALGQAYLLETFTRLARRLPLSPLAGTDDEWLPADDYSVRQNTRCSTVYRDAFDNVYDTHAVLFSRPNGNCYALAGKSVKPVTFPYMPNPEIREYVEDQDAAAAG